jgi:hypothetical protein
MSARPETLQERRKEMDAQTRSIRAREAKHMRAQETRRKTTIGGMVLKMVNSGELQENWLRESIEKHLTERDQKLFSEGYAKTLEAIQEMREGKGETVTIEELKAIAEAEREAN